METFFSPSEGGDVRTDLPEDVDRPGGYVCPLLRAKRVGRGLPAGVDTTRQPR